MLDSLIDGSTGIEKMQPNIKYIHLRLHVTTPTNLLHDVREERRAQTLQTETGRGRGTIESTTVVWIFSDFLHWRYIIAPVGFSFLCRCSTTLCCWAALGCLLSVGCLWLRCDLFIYPVDSSWKLVTVHTLRPRMMLLPFARSFLVYVAIKKSKSSLFNTDLESKTDVVILDQ